MAAPLTRIWSIQYLRALAACTVILFHQFQSYGWLAVAGKHGVDLFFVISGFIMVAMTEARDMGPRRFMIDRLTRIVPPYWFATAAAFILVALGLPLQWANDRWDLLAKSLLFIPSYNTFGDIWPTLYLGWTLNYEMFFYALFAACLALPRGLRLPALSAILVLLTVSGTVMHSASPVWQVYTNPLLLEFLAGALLGKAFGPDLHRHHVARQIGTVTAVVLGLALAALVHQSLWAGAAAVSIVGLALVLERYGRVPQIRWLGYLGDASFALYLFQQFGFDLSDAVYDAAARKVEFLRAHEGARHYMGALAAFIVGLLAFRFVERPLTRWTRGLVFGNRPSPAQDTAVRSNARTSAVS